MNTHARTRTLTALLLSALLLAAPMSAMAKKGEKNFKRGITHERAQQWEQAAQEFALAVAASPSDTEYQLHYRRAVFNASQVYMQMGRSLADKGDYVGAYNAFRQAYGYDPVNELAANEMRRVLRLQRVKEGLDPEPEEPANGTNGGMRVQPTTLSTGGAARGASVSAPAPAVEERAQPLRQINYNGDLEDFIRKMADELSLNVVFDQQFAQTKRNIKIQLRDVTAAQALDYIFMAYGLFFQKLSRRTILVADQSKRPQYQQLVLKTFYLYNIKPTDARTLIQTALPANAGRQPQVVTNAETNSIIVRDTPENVRIIGELLKSVDKERAEVVMEVAIYEVSRTDLLQIGNQFGTGDTLTNLGGLQTGSVLFDGARRIAGAAAGATLPVATGVGLIIPASSLSALQRKNNARLVFSTAVHAFDDEKSEARVGARVPVQTASVYNGLTAAPTTGTGAGATASAANVFGNGYPVIQYEDTGLVLDFTPKVYPNQEVQVKMNIETKDTDGNSLTPTFTQRKITGTARIPNGRTMMLASIGQDRETNGRQGLPLLGLIPILGRLFTAPTKNNVQSDVVITLTPRILRAPEIKPSDEETKDSGTMQSPRTETLEAVIRDADREDALAAARRIPTTVTARVNVPVEQSAPAAAAANVQTAPVQTAPAQTAPARTAAANAAAPNTTAPRLPAAIVGDDVSFVPAPKFLAESAAAPAGKGNATAPVREAFAKETGPPAANASVVNVSAPAENKPSAVEAGGLGVAASASAPTSAAPAEPVVDGELLLVPEQQELKAGERRRLMMMLKTDAPLGLVAATLRFDPRTVAVRSVSSAVLSADKAGAPLVTHTIDSKGVLVVSVAPASGATPLAGEGLLLIIEVEGLAVGEATISLDADKVHFVATDGRTVRARATAPARLKVIQ